VSALAGREELDDDEPLLHNGSVCVCEIFWNSPMEIGLCEVFNQPWNRTKVCESRWSVDLG
jgi:hypothetical protein